jgi:hypothetical protein
MTVTELRKELEKLEKEEKGNSKIFVVSSDCEPLDFYTAKWTSDIEVSCSNNNTEIYISDY